MFTKAFACDLYNLEGAFKILIKQIAVNSSNCESDQSECFITLLIFTRELKFMSKNIYTFYKARNSGIRSYEIKFEIVPI
jgi:hypothetical protein